MHISSVALLALVLVGSHVVDAIPRPHVRMGYKANFVKQRSLPVRERDDKRDVAAADLMADGSTETEAQDSLSKFTSTSNTDGTTSTSSSTGVDTVPPTLNSTSPEVSSIVSQLIASTSAFDSFTYSAYSPPTSTISSFPTSTISASPTATASSTAASQDPVSLAVAAAESYAMAQYMNKVMPTVTVELVLVPSQVR